MLQQRLHILLNYVMLSTKTRSVGPTMSQTRAVMVKTASSQNCFRKKKQFNCAGVYSMCQKNVSEFWNTCFNQL